jgi:HPt (histidine-containing phosphotransfer) domain-containing protein
MPDLPVIDFEKGIAACGGSRDLHAQIAGLLAGDLEERIAALRRALLAGDLVTTGRMAHKHKGACLAVGASALSSRFGDIDAAARANDTTLVNALTESLIGDAIAFCQAVAATPR